MKMQVGRMRAPLLAAALLSCSLPGLRATSLARLSLAKLTASAVVVAQVRCLGSETRWRGGEIWTVTQFAVTDVWKGKASPEISVWLIGGRSGNLVSLVSGVPRFQPGEEAVLFLEPTRSGLLSVTSWAQGTFRIHRDRVTEAETVTQDTAAVPVFDASARRFLSVGIRGMPLAEFQRRVFVAEKTIGAKS